MNSNRGFSLIELLVAMAVLAVITIFLLETFTVNNRNYVALDQTIEAQQNMRAIADLIELDVRHAGFMVPEVAAVCGVDSVNGSDILYVSDHEAIDPGDDMVAYGGARITGGAGNVVNGAGMALDSVIIEPPSPTRAAYDTNNDGTNDSDFQMNGGVIVADRNNPGRGVACGRVSAINAATDQVAVQFSSGNLAALAGTAELVIVPAIEYRVANGVMFRNGVRLARGVEDFQVAYLFDLDGNGAIAASEIRGAAGGTVYTASNQSIEFLRQLRINLVARTRTEDPAFSAGSFPAMENRTAIAGNDGFRRRVHTSTVMPRNLVNRMESI